MKQFKEYKVEGDRVIHPDGSIVYDDLSARAADIIAGLLTYNSILEAEKVGGGWQSIETAPKDGRLILVTGCNGFRSVLAAWYMGDSERYGNDGKARWLGVLNSAGVICIADPSHWMRLPDPLPPSQG